MKLNLIQTVYGFIKVCDGYLHFYFTAAFFLFLHVIVN